MLRLSTYNVLAPAYVRASYYPVCTRDALERETRLPRLVRRIEALDADVLCLQEVEPGMLSLPGYVGHFLDKRGKPDGCATYWRGLEVGLQDELRFADGSGHVALIVMAVWAGRRIAIANTHLKWDPRETPFTQRYAHRQLTELLEHLRELDCDGSVICGDLNVAPDDPVLGLLEAAGFRDAFRQAEPSFVANGRARKIDYVLCAEGRLKAEPLPVVAIHNATVLPSTTEPSDHLPLSVDLGWVS